MSAVSRAQVLLMSDGLKTFLGYCLAVTAATLPFVTLTMLPTIPNFEAATSNSIEIKTQHFIEMAIFIQFAAWLFVFVLAAIPFLVGMRVAGRDKISSCKFHVIGGTITAMLIGPLASFIQLGINVTEPQPWEGYQYLILMPFFAPFGALAGFTFWRFANFKTAVR
jgi:hypothetical protein